MRRNALQKVHQASKQAEQVVDRYEVSPSRRLLHNEYTSVILRQPFLWLTLEIFSSASASQK